MYSVFGLVSVSGAGNALSMKLYPPRSWSCTSVREFVLREGWAGFGIPGSGESKISSASSKGRDGSKITGVSATLDALEVHTVEVEVGVEDV